MDMAFLQRAERMLAHAAPARLDHGLLLAALTGQRADARPCRISTRPAVEEPLVELLLGGAGWQRAALAQRGCFNRAEAGRHRNAP